MKGKIATISIVVNAILALGKITVGLAAKSSSILAEGIHSFMDIISSAVSYLGIKISEKPGDKKHPYGHYKFENLSGTVITLILFITGGGIIYEAYQSILNPKMVELNYLSFGVMALSAVINEVMSRLKIHYGKKEDSIALLSDGIHSRVDVFASLAVFGGLFLTKFWIYADPVLALLVGLYVIKESFSIGKEAIASLLDVSAGEAIEDQIKLIARQENAVITSIKTQKKGSALTVNLEIKLPGDLSVEKAAATCNELREELMKGINNLVYVAIQVASHQVKTGFYRPSYGKGFGWQRRGKFIDKVEGSSAQGPGGECVCPKCGYKITHQPRTPCSSLECPNCQVKLERQ